MRFAAGMLEIFDKKKARLLRVWPCVGYWNYAAFEAFLAGTEAVAAVA